MGVFTLYFLVPIWWLFIASTKDRGDLLTTNALWFADWNFFANVGDLFAYNDGIFLRWLLNSLGYAGLGALLATVRRGHGRLRAGEVPLPRPRGRLQRRARRRARARDRARAAAVPAVQPGRPDEHVLGGAPAEHRQPVRRLPQPHLRDGERARRAHRGRPHRRRGRGAHVLHDLDPAHDAGARHRLPLPVRRRSGTTSSCR